MEAKSRKMAMTWMLQFVIFLLGASRGVDGRIFKEQHTGSGGYNLHSVVKEYADQQGFEAKLVVSSPSGNDTLGQDISPLNFIVRWAINCSLFSWLQARFTGYIAIPCTLQCFTLYVRANLDRIIDVHIRERL